jgi:protein TonB
MIANASRNILRVPAPSSRNPVTLVDPSLLQHEVSSGPPTLDRSLFPAGRPVTPTIQTSSPKHWRISGGVEEGLQIRNVKPIYPAIALAAGIEGEVVLQAEIGKDGRIENLRAVSGNPLLIRAALDAVQQWRYRPYLLNGGPVEVETQITVRFGMH